jgi:predicted RNase H-like nuclease
MLSLHHQLSARVAEWRDADYPSDAFPAIAELLEWSRIPESGELRYALADVPERKQDLVEGRYQIDVAGKPATVAVRITDVLGEEILVVREV